MLANVNQDRARAFADALVAEKGCLEASIVAGMTVKSFGAQSKFYVYALADPRSDRVFYVGKGSGKRAARHQQEARGGKCTNALKAAVISDLDRRGLRPAIYILFDSLTADDALRLERRILVRAHHVLTNIAFGEKPLIDRVRAQARDGLAQIMPLCALLRQRPDPFRLKAWEDIVTRLARIAFSGTV